MEKKDLIAQIEQKIAENALSAIYFRLQVTEEVSDVPKVGIWWYLQGKIIKVEKLVKDCYQDDLICVEQEHHRTFPIVQRKYADEIPQILEVKFDNIERGRVWAEIDPDKPDKVKYIITCSSSMTKNYSVLAEIKESFGLSNISVKVQAHGCMYDREIKL